MNKIISIIVFITLLTGLVGNTFAGYSVDNLTSIEKKELSDFKITIKNKEFNWLMLYTLFDKLFDKKFTYKQVTEINKIETIYNKRISFLLKLEDIFENKLNKSGIVKYKGNGNYKELLEKVINIQKTKFKEEYDILINNITPLGVDDIITETEIDYNEIKLDYDNFANGLGKQIILDIIDDKIYGTNTIYAIDKLTDGEKKSLIDSKVIINNKEYGLFTIYKGLDKFINNIYGYGDKSNYKDFIVIKEQYEKRDRFLLLLYSVLKNRLIKEGFIDISGMRAIGVLKLKYKEEYEKIEALIGYNDNFFIENKEKIEELNEKYGFVYNPLIVNADYSNWGKGIAKSFYDSKGAAGQALIDNYAAKGIDITQTDYNKNYVLDAGTIVKTSKLIMGGYKRMSSVNNSKNRNGLNNLIYWAPYAGELKYNSNAYKVIKKAFFQDYSQLGRGGLMNVYDLEKIPGIDYSKASSLQNGDAAYKMVKAALIKEGLDNYARFNDSTNTIGGAGINKTFSSNENYKLKTADYINWGTLNFLFNR